MAGKVISKLAENVVYLYGVSESAPAKRAPIAGVQGSDNVETISCVGLTCWVSRVSRSGFADNLARNMENLDWLSEKSVAHQRAVAAISEQVDVLPARFGTVFLTEESMCADVKSRKSEIAADLERIRGCDEWGIKVLAITGPPPAQSSGKLTGKEYLRVKSQMLRAKTPVAADEEVERFDSALREVVIAMAEAGKITAGRKDLIYNLSVLVNRKQRKRFENLLREFSSRWAGGKKIECTGPWPPYSFVSRRVE